MGLDRGEPARGDAQVGCALGAGEAEEGVLVGKEGRAVVEDQGAAWEEGLDCC